MIHAAVRVASLRTKIAAELLVLSTMERHTKDRSVRKDIRMIRNWFEDVESFFLERLSRESRSLAQEATWLDGAETFFRLAAMQSQRIKKLLERIYPAVKYVG